HRKWPRLHTLRVLNSSMAQAYSRLHSMDGCMDHGEVRHSVGCMTGCMTFWSLRFRQILFWHNWVINSICQSSLSICHSPMRLCRSDKFISSLLNMTLS